MLARIITERTYLREFTTEDAENIYALNLNPEVIQYTGDKPFGSVDETRAFLENYDQYQKWNVGRLAVISKINSVFLGWCGLKYNAEKNEYDIGYRFFKQYWGKGLATETAKASLDHGFNELGLTEIVAHVRKENTASIKVLEKIGLTYRAPFDFDGNEGYLYKIEK